MNPPSMPDHIEQLHQLYCRLTDQTLGLRFDRQRLWYEFIKAGFSAQDLSRVIGYLQKQIRQSRRNVGALKLSNLLQLDRFEEDLNISRVRLTAPPRPPCSKPSPHLPNASAAEQEQGRQRAIHELRQLQDKLRRNLI